MSSAAATVVAHAEALYRKGEIEAAHQALAPMAQAASADADVIHLLGRCRLRMGDTAGALALLSRARDARPHDALVRLHLGLALLASGRAQAAAEIFAACREALPGDPAPSLNLASALLALGQPRAAVSAASDACTLAPQMAAAHYTYGLAWLALNETARAGQAFTAALNLQPDLADAWVNLGVVRYRQGDMQGANGCMRNALQLTPGHRAATANLGAFMRLSGAPEAAERLLRSALERDPQAVEVRLNLAAELLAEERPQEALALLAGEPPQDHGGHQHWRLQQALALLQLGRPAEAEQALDRVGDLPTALEPLRRWREVLLALARGDVEGARRKAVDTQATLEATGEAMVAEHQIMAHYDLAKFWSTQKLPDRAFPHWVQGHALLKRFQPFSREAYRAFVDASLQTFDRARLHHGARAQDIDPAPVFIVGMPRSGTTLAEQILAAHPQVHGAGERTALADAVHRLGGGDVEDPETLRRIAALDGEALERASAAYLAELHALAPGKSRIVDKMPGNFRHLGVIALMLPGARIIHCVRDPRDVGLSIFTFRFHGHHPYAHDLGDLGWYIGEHDRLMAHWREALPAPILTLPMSAWVEDLQGTAARVLAFVGLPYDAACERFYENSGRVRTMSRTQVRQPINARGLGRWRPYAAHLEPMIRELDAAGRFAAWDRA